MKKESNNESNILARDEEQQKVAVEVYEKFRDDLLKRSLSNTEKYDGTIITLSAATLGFSMIALRYVVPLESSTHLWLVIVGWFMLFMCIATSLFAHLVGNKAIDVQLINARNYYIEARADSFNKKNLYITINRVLNISTGTAFLVALFAIILFVTMNVKKEGSMSNKEIETTDLNGIPMKKSADVPTMEQVPGKPSPTPQGSDKSKSNNSGSKPNK